MAECERNFNLPERSSDRFKMSAFNCLQNSEGAQSQVYRPNKEGNQSLYYTGGCGPIPHISEIMQIKRNKKRKPDNFLKSAHPNPRPLKEVVDGQRKMAFFLINQYTAK